MTVLTRASSGYEWATSLFDVKVGWSIFDMSSFYVAVFESICSEEQIMADVT